MSLELIIKQVEETKPAEVRIKNWDTFLRQMFVTETAICNVAINADVSVLVSGWNSLPNAKKIAKIPEMEALLKDIKKKAKETEDQRKTITSTLDNLGKRLMLPEKTIAGYATVLGEFLLKCKLLEKQDAEKKAEEERKRLQFRKNIQDGFDQNVMNVSRHIALEVARIKKEIIEKAVEDDFFDYSDFLVEEEKRCLSGGFKCPSNSSNIPEQQEVIDEIYSNWDSESFKKHFEESLKSAIANIDEEIEFARKSKENADLAKKAADSQAEAAIENAKEELEVAQVASTLSQTAVSVSAPVQATKELRYSYEIDMLETKSSMIAVTRAFFDNFDKCASLYRGESLFNMTVHKFGQLLCELKKADNAFAPQGVIFKKVTKL